MCVCIVSKFELQTLVGARNQTVYSMAFQFQPRKRELLKNMSGGVITMTWRFHAH